MTTRRGSAQAALLARILAAPAAETAATAPAADTAAAGVPTDPAVTVDPAAPAVPAAPADEVVSGLLDDPAGERAAEDGTAAEAEAEAAAEDEAVAEGLSDCVERHACGGFGDAEPEAVESAVQRPVLRSVGGAETAVDGGADEGAELRARDNAPAADHAPEPEASSLTDAAPEAAVGAGPAPAGREARPAGAAARRRGPADPVRGMMHRHEELCAGAVDVLEIAAGLEARGVTDQVAARFRHRDVFSLADELYARVPRGTAGERTVPARKDPVRVGLLHLVPGAGCAAAAVFVVRSSAVGAVVALLVALTTWAALRRGPLRAEDSGGALYGGWLLAFALCGGPLLTGLLGAPFEPPATAPFVALALTLAPAAWCAHRFALRARAELVASRGLAEFAARVRPLLAGTLALYLAVLLALLWAAAALAGPAGVAGACALGMLLFTARLLAVHGSTGAAAWGTGAAAAAEVAALGTAALHHVSGLAALSVPVERVGPAAVPVLACGCAAAVLVVHAFRTLTRAPAHGAGARPRPTDLGNTNQEQR